MDYKTYYSSYPFAIMVGKAKTDARLTKNQTIITGAVAAILSRTFTSPLNVIKILTQVGTKETQDGLFKAFQNVYKSEGIYGFWRGNGISCLRFFSILSNSIFCLSKTKIEIVW